MSDFDRSDTDYLSASESLHQLLAHLFSQLRPEEVEQFYQSYAHWQLQQRIEAARGQIERIRQQIAENERQMRRVRPSTLAFAAIARLQSQDVNDIDLLDRMLERGEDWLDHTMLLLDQCERLGLIYGDYTQWCEHALEGAYDWITSIDDNDNFATMQEATSVDEALPETGITEEILLRKFMSEHEEDVKRHIDELAEQALDAEASAPEDTDATDDTDTPDKDNNDDENDDSPDTDPGRSDEAFSEHAGAGTAPAASKEDVLETPEQAGQSEEIERQAARYTRSPLPARTMHRRLKEQIAHHTLREAVIAGQRSRGIIYNRAANWPMYT